MAPNRIPIFQSSVRGPVAQALVETARAILQDDLDKGRLTPVVADEVTDASQAPLFLRGLEIGMGYAFALMLTGQMDLRLLEIKPPGGSGY